MTTNVRCLFLRPGGEVQVVMVPAGDGGFREMERLMECDCFDSVLLEREAAEFALYVDDEGLLKGLPPNIQHPRYSQPGALVGPILLVKHDAGGDQVSLDADEVVRLTEFLESKRWPR